MSLEKYGQDEVFCAIGNNIPEVEQSECIYITPSEITVLHRSLARFYCFSKKT